MSINPLYNEYTPTKIVINNLGINIEATTNDSLALNSEYLVVGERPDDDTFSMIVDSRGFSINSKLENRRTSTYDNEIYGKTLLKGDVYVEGTIIGGNISGGSGGQTSFGNIFNYSYNCNNIYYNGQTTFGSYDSSSNNLYMVNISKSITRNINKAQFAIQNNKSAVAQMAIIGESKNSPLIFNTSSNVPIEFHIGRDKAFFDNAYKKKIYPNGKETIVDSDLPTYVGKSGSPHLNIDTNGNVGIKTDFNSLFRYNVRGIDTDGSVEYTSEVSYPDLFVNGTTFSSNILMFDYETNTHKNLDELYSRRDGQSIVLENIVPGKFAKGFFQFQSNISIMGDIDRASSLIVYGDTSNTGDIRVDGNIHVKNTVFTRTLDVEEEASFHNNIFIQDNIYVKANIYKYTGTSANNEDNYEIVSINNSINLQNGSASDFIYFGSGYSTKGRLGVGIDTTRGDPVNNQLVVTKRDKSIFELELTDLNYLGFIKTAFIGHAKTDTPNRKDGSLVFVTPSPNNRVYHSTERNAKQNIYFYPGYDEPMSTFSITSNNTPTLGIFVDQKVGIKTFSPTHDFDVNGDVAVTGNYYIKRKNATDIKMGIWGDRTFGNDSVYGGIFYYNEASPHVGINTFPSEDYGLVVSGKLVSTDGYYTADGFKMIPLYNSTDASTKPTPEYEYAYLYGRLGIGDLESLGTLSVRESYEGLSTSVKILNSPFSQQSTLHFVGNANEYIQTMNDTDGTFEICNGSSPDKALITKMYSSGFNQLILNSNISYGLEKPNDALVVNGNVDIHGDLNITGHYKISSRAVEITAGEPAQYYKTPDTSDNVYITGESIHLNTNTSKNGALYIGWRDKTGDAGGNALINVALQSQPAAAPTLTYITKYSSLNNNSALSQYKCKSGYVAMIGISDSKFFIGGDTSSPYITVGKVGTSLIQNYTSMGVGTNEPNGSRLHVYTQINEQPLTTFTRYNGTSDSDSIFADISLEKKIKLNSYKWNIQGPVLNGNTQKLQFLYQDTVNAGYCNLTEKLCITKDGYIGINSPFPKYGLDISGSAQAGSIRLHNSGTATARQSLVLQSGSNDYGYNISTDYSIHAFKNTFSIVSCDISRNELPIMDVSSNNCIGLNQPANEKYSVSIRGSLNVTDELYINDRRFFSAIDNNGDNGSYLEWKNIFINPEGENYGGVSINGGSAVTSNIFQVNAGFDGNVAVFNSPYPQSLIHFRNLHRNPAVESEERIWRTGSSNNCFILEHRSNVSYSELLITDEAENYARVTDYIQSDTVGEFIQRINGSIGLTAINPKLVMNSQNVLGTLNDNMYITTSNLGIGTSTPFSKLSIVNNDEVSTLNIRHNNTINNIVAINDDAFVITHGGDVGIGTSTPSTTMHVIGNAKIENSGISTAFEVVGNSIFRNNVTVKGNVVNDSDYRIKTDVKVIEDALSKIKKISGYTFLKNGVSPRETGVIAQEIKEVLPEAVFEHSDGLLGVAYGNMIGLLIEGIKELSDKIDHIYLKIDR